jgi:RNA polymerase sigma-70 factor (ECF subfamily)
MALHGPDAPAPKRSKEPAAARAQWFATTHWSVVLAARRADSPESAAALEKLCRTYWPPLYVWARHQGYSPPDAQDLVQGFFHLLLRDKLLARVDPQAGRFRSFLLGVFNHFLAHEVERANAVKRGGGQVPLPLDEELAERLYLADASRHASPDLVYARRWAMALLEQALNTLEAECAAAGQGRQFELLHDFLTDEAGKGAYGSVAHALDLTPNAVAVTVHRLRRRFRELVRLEIAQTVSSEAEIDEEMQELFAALRG